MELVLATPFRISAWISGFALGRTVEKPGAVATSEHQIDRERHELLLKVMQDCPSAVQSEAGMMALMSVHPRHF